MYSAVAIDEDGNAVAPVPIFQRRKPLGAALGAFLFVMIGVVGSSMMTLRDGGRKPSLTLAEDTTEETLKVSNAYERLYGRSIGDGVYPHDYLVAVMKPTKLEFHSGSDADWFVRNEADGSFSELASGASEATFVFEDVGTTRVRAVRSTDGKTYDFDVDARIVRYELRDLSDEDRERYFSALRVLHTTGHEEGARKYGPQYRSIDFLVRQHLYGAADKACDHWHDDAGFLTHHIGITWEMEESLRLIDPSTAAHYWDYSRESVTEKNSGDVAISWWESAVFLDSWFGSNSPSNPDHIITEGRWGYTPLMTSAREYSGITNPYGLLRSPWNTNPTPYVMRYNHSFNQFGDGGLTAGIASCDSGFASYLNLSLAKVLDGLNGDLHGGLHIMIGGMWNFREFWKGADHAQGDAHLLLSKFMWRQGYVRVPDVCSDDTPAKECMPTCPEAIRSQFASAEQLLNRADVGATYSSLFLSSNNDDGSSSSYSYTYDDLLDELCHVGYAGEMFTSAAPQDPIFWASHGNAERYVQALRWYQENDFISGFDQTWGYAHHNSATDTHLVCDWSGIDSSSDITTMPKCVKAICPGHKEDDTLPFVKVRWADGKLSGVLTNGELYDRVGPSNKNMPYVYDAVLYWKGCTGESLYVAAAKKGIVRAHDGN